MSNDNKNKPDDGSKAEEIFEAEDNSKRIAEEESAKTMETFIAEAEADYNLIQEQKKEQFLKLKKSRERGIDKNDEKDSVGGSESSNGSIYGQEVDLRKKYSRDEGEGIFNAKGNREAFGKTPTKLKIARALKIGARGIALKRQREFMQLLDKYHGFKGRNLSTLEKSEVKKFEGGLRRGESDSHFKRFTQQLKKEGMIKNSADVKKLFSKEELRKISGALTGNKDSNPFKRADRTELINRRAGEAGSNKPPRSI